MIVGMPTDYTRNKPMHTREVRYERNDRERPFPAKRDWHRVAVFERSPSLNSVGAGSYEPPSKRRPSGRHGFSGGDNGRYGREHSRISEHQPVFGVGYSNFGHKNDQRYVVGGMGHYSNGRNGFKDAEEDPFRDRGLSQERAISSPPSYHLTGQPLHSYNAVFEDGHRGSRYSWDSVRQQRPSCSPDVVPERRQVRWDVTDKEYEGRLETRFDDRFDRRNESRFDRYGTARDPSFPVRDAGFSTRDATSFTSRDSVEALERTHEFGDSFKAHRHQQTQFSFGTTSLREEKASSPRKRTRLGWGQGLAKYEQKKIVESEPPAEHCRASEASTTRSSDSGFESKEVAAYSRQWCQVTTNDTSSRHRELPQVQGSEAAANCNHVHEEFTRTTVSSPEPAKQPSEPPLAAEAADESSSQLKGVTAAVDDDIQGSFVEEAAPSENAEAVKEEDSQSQVEVAKTEKDGVDADLVRETSVEPPSSNGLECVSKEVALLRVEQLEFQIDSIEKELIRLDVQGLEEVSPPAMDKPCQEQEPEQKREHGEEEELQEEATCDPLVPEDATEDRAQDAGCSDRQEPSRDCLAAEPADAAAPDVPPGVMDRLAVEFAHLLPAELSSKLYSSPQEAPPWEPNEELHNDIKHRIMHKMLKKRQELKFKEQSLALKYRLLKAISGEVADEHPRKKGGRTADVPGRTEGDGDIMEHRHHPKRFLLEPVRPVKERLKMPAMILDDRDKPLQYIASENRLVEDPVKYEQDRKSINPWTPEERKVFLEKFGLFYKNFARIATYLEHKTVGDCIEYYYRNQKAEEFAKLRKRHKQNKRRHLRSSYMATTGTGRLRESTAAHMHTVASAASSVGRDTGKPSRTTLKVVDQERLSAVSDCVTLDAPGKHAAGKAGNLSGSIVTGVCSLSSDAPLTPSRIPCQRTYCREDRQKGGGRREYGRTPDEDAEAEWSDNDRKLFLDGLLQFGKDFRCISLHLRTKSEWQCKAFFCKTRKRLKLDKILEKHEAAHAAARMEKQASPKAAGRSKCRTSENEDMDVSTVVDKEGNGTDAEDTGEDTSAAVPFVDSPVSSVITSPGLAPVSPSVAAAKAGEPVGASSACVQNCKANQPELDLSRRCKDDGESCDNKPAAAAQSRKDPLNGVIHQSHQNGFQQHHLLPAQLEQQQQLLQFQSQPNHLLLHQHYLTSTALQPTTTVKQESHFTTNNELFLQPQLSEPAASTMTQLQTAAVTPLVEDRFFLLEQQQPQVRQGDVKLFGVPLVSTTTTVTTTTTQPLAEPRPVSWCAGSAESLDRRQASLSAAASAEDGAGWQVHQPELMLWKAAAVSEPSLATVPLPQPPQQQPPPPPLPSPLQVAAGWGHLGGLAGSQRLCAVQHQPEQQQQQQQQQGSTGR